MLPGQANEDFMIGGSTDLQQRIRALPEYTDILSFNAKGKAMSVPLPLMKYLGRLRLTGSKHISVGKHAALNKMIDHLLDLEVIQASRATAWSQVHLVR